MFKELCSFELDMGVFWKVFLLVVSAYLIQHSVKVINITGLLVHRFNHQPGPCRLIPGIEYGSEDIQTLPHGVAVISAGWATIQSHASDDLRGIYMFDFNHPDQNVTKLKMIGFDIRNLTPHGLSLWTDSKTGIVTLFVVNHGPTTFGNESIEVFQFDEKTKSIHHQKTIRDRNFKRMNDVVATSSETFYATNDCTYFEDQRKWNIETYLQTGFGNVVYFDGHHARVVASGYVLPNGINLSPDKRTVYLPLTGEAQMVVLDRQEDNSLTEVKRVELYMARADNVDVLSNGDLWIAGSWKLFPDEHGQMSSMVLHATVQDKEFTFSEVYINDGSILQMTSVASFYNNQLLIGTPEHKLLYCKVKAF